MPVMDEFKEERAALKNGTPKQKFQYFLDYYKWHVIIAVAVIGLAGSWIYQVVTSRDTAFYAAFINAFEITPSAEYAQRFADYAGIDTDQYNISFDVSMHIEPSSMDQNTVASSQRLMVYVAAGEIDVLISDTALVDQYAYSDTFDDIRTVLTKEQIERYEPFFFYMDQAVADAINAALDKPDDGSREIPAHPDPRKPESMEKPVPVGIYLDEADALRKVYYFTREDAVLAVSATSKNRETIPRFLDFLMEE